LNEGEAAVKLDLAIRGGTVIIVSDSSRCDVGVRVCFGMQHADLGVRFRAD
jgi:hypothetical protein